MKKDAINKCGKDKERKEWKV